MKTSIFTNKFFLAALVAIGFSANVVAQSTTASTTLSGASPTAPTQFLGSSNNFNVVFKTNNVEKGRFSATGLALSDNMSVPNTKFISFINNGWFIGKDTRSVNGAQYGTSEALQVGGWNASGRSFQVLGTGWTGDPVNYVRFEVGLGTQGTYVRHKLHVDGSVGIGTNAPTQRLDVVGNAKVSGLAGTGTRMVVADANGLLSTQAIPTGGTGTSYWAANGTTSIQYNTGTVLIGNATTPAGYKLYVETGILTEKLKVALKTSTDWADYVFGKNYQLKPLAEVEAFVKENKHLPDVPSAQELVNDGGIDVGQMLAKQMQKIEELTLYMIDLQKQNDALKSKVEALEAQ